MNEPIVLNEAGNRLFVGTLVSLIGGFVFAGVVVAAIREDKGEFWKGKMLGMAERLFFTLAVVVTPTTVVVPAMLTWIGAKMAAGWNQEKSTNNDSDKKSDNTEKRKREASPEKKARMAALGGGVASMFFALLGGLIAAGQIRWS